MDAHDLDSGFRLSGGEILEVSADSKYSKDNWLRVVSVDGKSRKGYIKRREVDVTR